MPRSKNKPYICKACRMVFKGKATTPCPNCGSITVRNGACYKCLNCGSTSGCS